MDMIQGAMKAYKMFSGSDDASSSGEGGGGGFLDNISMNDRLFRNIVDQRFFSQVQPIKMLKRCMRCTSSSIRMVMGR